MKEDERLNCVAGNYSHKQRLYGDLVIRIQPFFTTIRKVEKQMREKTKMMKHPCKDPDKGNS